MDGRSQRVAGPLTRRHKQVMAAVGAFVVAGIGGAGIWGAVHPGSYDGSRNGCITVNVPSSMGGAVVHGCGAKAKAMCASAQRRNDALSRLTRPECRAAGLAPASSSPP